jgi:nodulation protein E
MSSGHRVAVTGLGVVSALGDGAEAFWRELRADRGGIRPLVGVDARQLRFGQGAEARDFAPAQHFPDGRDRLLDRFAQFAVVAAREAVRGAALDWSAELREETAVVLGTGCGGQVTQEEASIDLYQRRAERVHPTTIPRMMPSAATSHVAMEMGIMGPAYTVSTACSSANHAIGQAFQMVRRGEVRLALAGGAEAPFTLGVLRGWEALRVVAPDTCRPFCRRRQGLILGEGAAVLVLEPFEAARARGARIRGELVGFGMSSDADHITRPTVSGPVRAMRAALRDAALPPQAVGYVNAHGTGTPLNDAVEARALRELFGAHADRLAVSSTKSHHGHALGAAGALEAAATVLALEAGWLPATLNFLEADPECDLDVIANHGRAATVEHALSSSFAFGGLNAVLAFRAPG